MTGPSSNPEHTRFVPGSTVRVSDRASLGHCRTPVYLRGRSGTVVGIAGRFRDPERLAYHKPGLPLQTLYRIRFSQRDLWPGYGGQADDEIEADIFEYWLEPGHKGQREQGT